jgi:hypothetical protein
MVAAGEIGKHHPAHYDADSLRSTYGKVTPTLAHLMSSYHA